MGSITEGMRFWK